MYNDWLGFRMWLEDTPPPPPTHLSNGVADVLVNSVGHLGSLHSAAELHVEDARVMSQPPVISLVTCQPCAVDARLLTCTNTHNLNIHTTRGKRGLEEGRARLLHWVIHTQESSERR